MLEKGISVVIPCYNCENTIERCLNSLLKCNYSDAEYILVNDKSTDRTLTVIENYAKSHKEVAIEIVNNEENLGAGSTRNVGISHVNKEYIVFVDSDDTVSVVFFDTINRVAKKYDCDCIVFDAELIDGEKDKSLSMFYGGNFVGEQMLFPKYALVYIKGSTCGKAYKTSIIRDNNIKYANIKRNEDLVFTKTAMSYCNSIYYTGKVLYHYHDNQNSLMHNTELLDKNNAFVAYEFIKKKLNNRDFEQELHSIYMIEVIYSTTITAVKKKEKAQINYESVANDYKYDDMYYKGYSMKYKLALYMFRLGMLRIVDFVNKRRFV